jgi:predicted acylesterase/phospholipase RssA
MTDDYADRFILASTAIPGIFPPVIIEGDSYVDGGLIMNTPLLPALRAGAATLHVVYLDPAVKAIPIDALQSTLDTMSRIFAIQFAAKMNQDIKRAAQVNRTLSAMERAAPSLSPDVLRDFRKAAGISDLRKVAIHRYHPRDDVGSGILGWLDFGRDRIAKLIERGFEDTVTHDCYRSGCVTCEGQVLVREAPELELFI